MAHHSWAARSRAFHDLALCMTATGTARFMAPMGYDIKVGYGVGTTLELAKGVLPVAVTH